MAIVSFTTDNLNSKINRGFRISGTLTWISTGKSSIWGVNSINNLWTTENIGFDFNGHISWTWKQFDPPCCYLQVEVIDF